MSSPNRISSRTRWAGVTGCGREPQMIPWWQSTIWAPARAAARNSSRWAETPVTTLRTSRAPGTWSPLGP